LPPPDDWPFLLSTEPYLDNGHFPESKCRRELEKFCDAQEQTEILFKLTGHGNVVADGN
jgi:hypothetical protein